MSVGIYAFTPSRCRYIEGFEEKLTIYIKENLTIATITPPNSQANNSYG